MTTLPTNLQGMTQEQLIAMIHSLKARPASRVSLKVTEKGGVSLYGLGRFPVTLYASQWDRLISEIETIRAFIDTNRASLATKD